MRWKSLVLVLAAGMVAFTAIPSEAAKRKRTHEVYGETRALPGVRTRVVVTRRSYLDAGTEVTPGTRKFTDYISGGPTHPMDPYWADWPSTFYWPYGRTPLPGGLFPWP